jgi:hypothetical protein
MYLTAQLGESAPYLKDGGWRDTAKPLFLAADEIESVCRNSAATPIAAPFHPMLIALASGGSEP